MHRFLCVAGAPVPRPTKTGPPRPSVSNVIAVIGFLLALGGLAGIGVGLWLLFDRPEGHGVAPGFGAVGVSIGLVLLGIDVMARPRARRLPRIDRLLEFLLRWRAGLGP
jgi:hypothetical protein